MNVSLLKLVSEGRLATEKAVGASNDIKGIMRDLGNQPRGVRRRK
jgi:hypothetical protein